MSNRQARIKRKAAQKNGEEAYVHLKPTERKLNPVHMLGGDLTGNRVQQQNRVAKNETKRRERLYGPTKSDEEKTFEYLKAAHKAETNKKENA